MPATQAQLGIGTQVYYETTPGASPLAFTQVPECLDIPPIVQSVEFVEATNQDSEDRTREYIPGLVDVEELTIQANYIADSAVHAAIFAMPRAGVKRRWRIIETTASPNVQYDFEAFVSSASVAMPVAEKKVFEFGLRITGPITRT